MSTLSLTYTLTPGTPENVSHVQQNFVDVRTWANGGISSTNITDLGIATGDIADSAITAPKLAVVTGARVFHNTTQSIADATNVAVAFNSERYDTATIHDTAVNNTRLTAPAAGIYQINAHVEFAASATGVRAASLRLNGATLIAGQLIPAPAAGTAFITLTTQYLLAATDYVEVIVNQSSGGPLNLSGAANYGTEFAICYLGKAA